MTPLVSQKYLLDSASDLDGLRDGYVDLSTHCINRFVTLIFTVDFRPVLPELFVTGKWYNEFAVKRMVSTFEDYVNDYGRLLHPSLLDIFVEELSDELLIRYLSSIRNKGVKFRHTDPFAAKFREDVVTAFEFFSRYPGSFNETIKPKWKVVDYLVRLLEAGKLETLVPGAPSGSGGVWAPVADVYQSFKQEFWDLQLSWVESVLRSRDDFERGMLNAVKARAAEIYVERGGGETIMGKVK